MAGVSEEQSNGEAVFFLRDDRPGDRDSRERKGERWAA